jgi:hypothetical protein
VSEVQSGGKFAVQLPVGFYDKNGALCFIEMFRNKVQIFAVLQNKSCELHKSRHCH